MIYDIIVYINGSIMKKLISMLFIAALILTGCGPDAEASLLTGEVVSISTDSFKIDGDLNGEEFLGYVDVDSATSLYNPDGERVRFNTLQVGDEVEVHTGGFVLQPPGEEVTPRVTTFRIDLVTEHEKPDPITTEENQKFGE